MNSAGPEGEGKGVIEKKVSPRGDLKKKSIRFLFVTSWLYIAKSLFPHGCTHTWKKKDIKMTM